MLLDDHLELKSYIDAYQKSIQSIFVKLDDLLSRDTKNYSVVFKGYEFNFNPAITKQEHLMMKKNRLKLVRLILESVHKQMLSFMPLPNSMTDKDQEEYDKIWDHILVFTYGADPVDFQCEKINIDELYKGSVEGELLSSIPLNEDNYQVKQEIEKEFNNDMHNQTVIK